MKLSAVLIVASLACTVGGQQLPAVTPAPTLTLAPGVEMPVVALGTGEYQGQQAIEAVQNAIRIGYRSIDTAHEYANQQAIGQGVRQILANSTYNLKRSDLFIITKVEGGLSAAETTARLKADVQQLDLGSTIDLVLLHYPKAAPFASLEATIQAQWKAISDFTRGGGARAAGVSQFCSVAFQALDSIVSDDGASGDPGAVLKPVLNQVGWHVGMGKDPCGVPSMCAARVPNVTVMAYSPLSEASSQLLNSSTTLAIAARHAVSPAQVALRWLAQRSIPYAVAASNPEYQAQNLDVFGFHLNDTEVALLDAAEKPSGCPFWPGSACWKLSSCTGCNDGISTRV